MVATILLRRLTELIESATDRSKQAVEPSAVAEVKRLARIGDSTLQSICELLLTRLKQPHSQARA